LWLFSTIFVFMRLSRTYCRLHSQQDHFGQSPAWPGGIKRAINRICSSGVAEEQLQGIARVLDDWPGPIAHE
jgi:hypothetical protein